MVSCDNVPLDTPRDTDRAGPGRNLGARGKDCTCADERTGADLYIVQQDRSGADEAAILHVTTPLG